jgi:hypothetical protein
MQLSLSSIEVNFISKKMRLPILSSEEQLKFKAEVIEGDGKPS